MHQMYIQYARLISCRVSTAVGCSALIEDKCLEVCAPAQRMQDFEIRMVESLGFERNKESKPKKTPQPVPFS